MTCLIGTTNRLQKQGILATFFPSSLMLHHLWEKTIINVTRLYQVSHKINKKLRKVWFYKLLAVLGSWSWEKMKIIWIQELTSTDSWLYDDERWKKNRRETCIITRKMKIDSKKRGDLRKGFISHNFLVQTLPISTVS